MAPCLAALTPTGSRHPREGNATRSAPQTAPVLLQRLAGTPECRRSTKISRIPVLKKLAVLQTVLQFQGGSCRLSARLPVPRIPVPVA